MADRELEVTQGDVKRFVAHANDMVVAQEQRLARLKALSLPIDDALDTLDTLKGTAAALAYFDRLLESLRR